MESQILCSESTIEVLNNISKDTSRTKNAGFLIGSYYDKTYYIYNVLPDIHFSEAISQGRSKDKVFNVMHNFERRWIGGVSIIGYFSPSQLSNEEIQCLFDNDNATANSSSFRSEHCLYISLDAIPDMKVIESEVHEVELTIPFYIQHDRILSINPKEYIRTQCESFKKSILLECNSSLLQTSYHIQKAPTAWKVYSINTKHDGVDGIANLHYILQFLIYEGETIQSIKDTIKECYYRVLLQSLHISVVSGCRVEQQTVVWMNKCMKTVEDSEKVVYYWNDPTKTSIMKSYFLALLALFIIFLYIKLQSCVLS